MVLQILGSGCPKCQELAQNAQAAIDEAGVDASVEKVTDADKIMDMGVAITPALAIDGEVKSAGKVLSADKIVEMLRS
ncbi:MAG: thioredoxin family protein [Spirochaetaceae bacterium]|nr:thioredoxin family protein [Spirochaetaceae bacterium]MCF7938920.1 thioredoxin family protein [Spirochaetales bacterium]